MTNRAPAASRTRKTGSKRATALLYRSGYARPLGPVPILAWIDRVEETWKVLPLDGRVLRLWGSLTHRRSDDLLVDALIAATALVLRHVIGTRNTRDFAPLGVEVFDPFTAGGADPGDR
jgi:predicted nucleic acid-binding protein